MSKFGQILLGAAISLLGFGVIIGAAIGVSFNPLTWLSFMLCAIVGSLIVWYGWAIAAGVDWE